MMLLLLGSIVWPVLVSFWVGVGGREGGPATDILTLCLHVWCMLGVFLLLAFICLKHEWQDLLSLYHLVHVCTD